MADVQDAMRQWYPERWAQPWDRVGLVVGDPADPVSRVLYCVDCVPETVDQAVEAGAELIVAHHPLLLRGVSSVATTSYKGRVVHRLIRAGIALYVAHTNADVAAPGVSDALAATLSLAELRPLVPAEDAAAGGGRGFGRIGTLPAPVPLAELTGRVAAALPATAWGIRAAGDPARLVRTVAVCGGAGDTFLDAATAAGVDAYLTADLRHHPASEHLAEGGPALLDAAHWATEWPWLAQVAAGLTDRLAVEGIVSSVVTDPWTVHAASGAAGAGPAADGGTSSTAAEGSGSEEFRS
ncbi:GTP cyclohydrolase 1 type 2 [Actinocatenispora thailandica]|uniref:GTP cyclohydrolase 1 type 2 homolog n=1 Tax=Actinocatenispora thailandica TaxID=227318 RepID=A0A7R7HWX7_9ACTN|nr:GTP cyclohydrolase 1 type 2 [Actinocatenispora thailandica]